MNPREKTLEWPQYTVLLYASDKVAIERYDSATWNTSTRNDARRRRYSISIVVEELSRQSTIVSRLARAAATESCFFSRKMQQVSLSSSSYDGWATVVAFQKREILSKNARAGGGGGWEGITCQRMNFVEKANETFANPACNRLAFVINYQREALTKHRWNKRGEKGSSTSCGRHERRPHVEVCN